MVTEVYVNNLPKIYKDILSAFPKADPLRRTGDGAPIQSLHAHLGSDYSISLVRAACKNMHDGGAVHMRNGVFVHPTDLGEELIRRLTNDDPEARDIPPFPRPAS